jgi:drug/metabolite transporter (DMT)-like permease
MGVLLGLLTALSWGSSDFLARFATRKIGTFRAMLYMQLSGLLLLTAALPWMGGFGHLRGVGREPWVWGIAAGVLNTGGTLALYRSFEIGKMSVVAPISASYPALTTLLVVLTGERLTLPRLTGLLLILLGVTIVARGEENPRSAASDANRPSSAQHRGEAAGWAFLAALEFGLMFWILGVRAVPLLGSAQAVWVIRLTSVALTTLVMLALRQPRRRPREGARWTVVGMGFLDTGAYVLNNYGMRLEQVSVITVLSSLYGAVTVGFAATILGEKISRKQWMGIAGIFTGIVFISR